MKYVLQNKDSPSDYAVLQVKSLRIFDDVEVMVVTTDIIKDATIFSEMTKDIYLAIVGGITKESWVIIELEDN